jgi:peptidoglycan hydrolase-like protein with peptidoglycan-binding domain
MNVIALQKKLQSLGFYTGKLDNRMGPKTIDAIKAFQLSHNLAVDGIVGLQTIAALSDTEVPDVKRRIGARGIRIIEAFEGEGDGDMTTPVLDPYICPKGLATVGRGHVILSEAGQPFNAVILGRAAALKLAGEALKQLFGTPYINEDQSNQLLAMDVNATSAQLIARYPTATSLADNVFDAVGSYSFNLGVGTFVNSSLARQLLSSTDKTLAPMDKAAVRSKAAATATIAEAFCAYSFTNHVWMLGLYRRRYVEAKLCLQNLDLAGLNTAIAEAFAYH